MSLLLPSADCNAELGSQRCDTGKNYDWVTFSRLVSGLYLMTLLRLHRHFSPFFVLFIYLFFRNEIQAQALVIFTSDMSVPLIIFGLVYILHEIQHGRQAVNTFKRVILLSLMPALWLCKFLMWERHQRHLMLDILFKDTDVIKYAAFLFVECSLTKRGESVFNFLFCISQPCATLCGERTLTYKGCMKRFISVKKYKHGGCAKL